MEPFFVCILGQRYGWVPETKDFKDKADQERQAAKPRSITDLEVRHAVLNDRRKRRSYFYLRTTLVPELPPAATDEQRQLREDFVGPPEHLKKLETLKADIHGCGRPVRSYECRWTGHGFTDMEEFGQMVLEDLWSGVLRDTVKEEVWRKVLGTDPNTDSRYTDESAPVPRELWQQIVALAKPEPKEPLDAERQQMEAFATSRLRWFQGRARELQQLTDFLHSTDADAPRLAVIAAVPGQGKSALLAKLWRDLTESDQSAVRNPQSAIIIAHFVGATERSASAHALVERLLAELDRSGITCPEGEQEERQEAKRDFKSLCLRLAQQLGNYAGERRIVILLDALNQLTDGHDLRWLPERLGPSVRAIVSCADDALTPSPSPVGWARVADGPGESPTPEQRVVRALTSRLPPPLRVPLGPLTEDDVRTIVVAYLDEYCHELDREHLDALCPINQAGNPLYLLVMLNELRTLGGNDLNRIVPARIASMAQDYPDSVSLFRWVLQRLEVFGPEAVRWWCLYLAHGRVGMASQELSDLLARKLGAEAAATALRIERGLRRYLQRRGPQLDFFHGQLRQAVFEEYSDHGDPADVHSDIATYFRELADPEGNQTWKGNNPRPFLQVMFHLVGAQRSEELCQTLCDLRFVEARCRHGHVFELIADYRLAQESLPEAQADRAQERLRREAMAGYTSDLIAYARAWSARRDRLGRGELVSEPEPKLPPLVSSCRMWTDEEIQTECQRIMERPNRLDRLAAFDGFVLSQCYALLAHGKRTGFVVQHALGTEPAGPIHDAARKLLPDVTVPILLRRWAPETAYNSKPALLRTLEGHCAPVRSVCVTLDGRQAVSVSWDNTLRMWDLESGRCLRTLAGHSDGIGSVSITPDGAYAVSGSSDHTLRVWDLRGGRCVRTLLGHNEGVASVTITPDGNRAVSGSWDSTLRVWDLESGHCIGTLEGHSGAVLGVSVTPDGRRAASASADETVRVWDLESRACLHVLEGHSRPVTSVCMTPDGRCVVSGSTDGSLRIAEFEKRQCIRSLTGAGGRIASVSMTPDRRLVVSVTETRTLVVWDVNSGQRLRIIKVHTDDVTSVSVTADGRRAVSASKDKTVRVWDLETGQCWRVPDEHSKAVGDIAVTIDGQLVVSASEDETLRIWHPATAQCLRMLNCGPVQNVIVTPDGRIAVSVGYATLGTWNLESWQRLHTLEGHTARITATSVTPDSRHALSGSLDGTLRLWNLGNGQCVHTMTGHCSVVTSVIVTPDGLRAVSAGGVFDGTLRLWDLRSGQCLGCWVGHRDGIGAVCLSSDGGLVVSASGDHTLRVWDLQRGSCLRILVGHLGPVTHVTLTPDCRRVVSASSDKTMRVWDLASGACLRILGDRSSQIGRMVVTSDSRFGLSRSDDKALQLWDLESGQCLGLYSLPAQVPSVALANNGDSICAGSRSGELLFLTVHGLKLDENRGPDSAPCGGDDSHERSLRRGLAFGRSNSCLDHESTLGHLAALAIHLEKMGKSGQASEFQREHDALAEEVAAKHTRGAP